MLRRIKFFLANRQPFIAGLCGLLCSCLPAGLGCRSRPAEIALIPTTTGVPLWDAVHAGAAAGGRDCGLRVHYNAPPREDDLRGQLTLFESSQKSFAGIILVPIQAQALRNPIQRAVAAGEDIVIMDADLGISDPHLSYVLNDEQAGGRLAAQEIGKLLKGRGTIAVLGVDPSRPTTLERDRSMEQYLTAHFPAIQVIARRIGYGNLTQGQQSAQDLLNSAAPPEVLVALGAVETRAAYYAVVNSKKGHAPHIVGFDQDLLEIVRTGEIDAIIAQRTHSLGKAAATLLCRKRAGLSVSPKTVITPMLITAESVDSPAVAAETGRDWWAYR